MRVWLGLGGFGAVADFDDTGLRDSLVVFSLMLCLFGDI